MTGVEVVGLVLASFPIILNCLDYYREGMEPLDEWWSFRTHFIEFVDDISHQMMRYNENMTRLLDPVVTDNESLAALVRDPVDPRWNDGNLDDPLEQRLASERDRFFRIIERMNTVVKDLKNLLQIDGDRLPTIGSAQQTSWNWQLTRIKISFSKGKHKKVRKLAQCNQNLQEILGYSERLIPIADRRKLSEPVTLFDRIRRHACSVHSALNQRWKCQTQKCQIHQAHLSISVATKTVSLNILFVVGGEQCPPHARPWKQEVVIQPPLEKTNASSAISATQISYVQQAACFTQAQEVFEESPGKGTFKVSKLARALKKTRLEPSSAKSNTQVVNKKVAFAPSVPVIQVSQHGSQTSPSPDPLSPQLIHDLCSFLRDDQAVSIGAIMDESDRHLKLSKSPNGPVVELDTTRLVPLPELLNAHHRAEVVISRQSRFAMAAHIASALLQAHMSPWLSKKWSKSDFSFLIKSGALYSSYPYVSRTFLSKISRTDTTIADSLQPSHSPEETRSSLFTVGVIILELIFGQNIETCTFRQDYYSADNTPNDQTDVSTAQRWAKKVLGECGADIDDVVRRCLDCSFGPKPSLVDARFKEAVYEGVIKPLMDYLKVWPEVMPLS
ncbi:hypothetical protein BDW59DRAFT_156118 [Aspergillus cavernicola]|uniref:DUF7580 domain-containing protein n=1 Tax=Aspergillus cavernicola TaxID=176166 RepID=A0ABR4J2B8_9EURO